MLTPTEMFGYNTRLMRLWGEVEARLVAVLARHIVGMDGTDMSSTTARLTDRLRLMRAVDAEIAKVMRMVTGRSQREIQDILTGAANRTLFLDDALYAAAGIAITPIGSSQALKDLLRYGIFSTNKAVRNLANTTARSTNNAFVAALDTAMMRVISGAYGQDQALRMAVEELSQRGIDKVAYPTGRKQSMDSAARMALSTGLNQTLARMQLERMNEMGTSLVEVSWHLDARPTHEVWQGGIYSVGGVDAGYEHFEETTGYGDFLGLCGVNCYHTFWPFVAGVSGRSFAAMDSIGAEEINEHYQERQTQRRLERYIRTAKRAHAGYTSAHSAATSATLRAMLKKDMDSAASRVRRGQARMRDYIRETGRTRLYKREAA